MKVAQSQGAISIPMLHGLVLSDASNRHVLIEMTAYDAARSERCCRGLQTDSIVNANQVKRSAVAHSSPRLSLEDAVLM